MRGYMNKSTKLLLASVSPVALAAGWAVLDSAPAHATVTVTGTAVTYASENFIGTSAASSIIVGATGIVISTNANTTSDFSAGFMTFTLSNGATFAAAPSASTVNVTLGSGSLVSGSTAVTYQVTGAQTTSAASITLGNFSITGVGTRLATSNQNITVTYAALGPNVPGTPSATIAVGAQAYAFAGVSSAASIDLANSGAGLVFRSGSPASNVSFASLGTLTQPVAAGSNDISGTNQFTASSSDTLRAIVNGNLSAFSSIYAATASCAATAPSGALTGTIASDSRSATISPLTVATTYNICAVANGTTIVPSGTITGSASFSFASRTVSGATYTPGAYSQSASTLSTLSYNGSTATAYYVVGLGSYVSAIRLSNTSTSAGSVFVQVTPDTTGTPVRALLDSTLAAGQSKFYLASDIRTAVGTSVLTDSNNRATVVFLTSFSGLQLQNFIVNPGGVLSGGTSVGSSNTTGN
jgi:hypothetical protein